MKKIAKLITAAALMAAPFAAVQPVAATTTYKCPSGYIMQTGSDSKNICVSETEYVCIYTGDNGVNIFDNNEQLVMSGVAVVKDNDDGGMSATGSATNENNVTFDVTVTSRGEECVVVASVPPSKVVKEEKPVTTTTTKVTPTVLPNTSSDVFSTALTVIAVFLGLGAVGTFLGVTAYRLFQTKS
jgi:hypothetical protein